ncbi:MAG: hypothetical protein FWE48_05805 [Coriobacteriia bacterium]|nr:hypothetical protein [Coriobacteriia bacterium]
MSLQDNHQVTDAQNSEQQTACAEKKKHLPVWAIAFISLAALVFIVVLSAALSYVMLEMSSGREPFNSEPYLELSEVQEDPSVDLNSDTGFDIDPELDRAIVRETSPEWDLALAAFKEVMEQYHFPQPGSWRGEGLTAISDFRDFMPTRAMRNVTLSEFESAYFALQEYQWLTEGMPEHQLEEIAGVVSRGHGYTCLGFYGDTPVRETVLVFGNYVFDAVVDMEDHARYIVPLLDTLQYKTMTEIPEDPIREFREAVLSMGRFGDYDAGYVQHILFSDGGTSITLYERHDDLGGIGFRERMEIREPLEYQIVREEPYVHYWAIEDWGEENDIYIVSIYYLTFLYEFVASMRSREMIDEIISKLGF